MDAFSTFIRRRWRHHVVSSSGSEMLVQLTHSLWQFCLLSTEYQPRQSTKGGGTALLVVDRSYQFDVISFSFLMSTPTSIMKCSLTSTSNLHSTKSCDCCSPYSRRVLSSETSPYVRWRLKSNRNMGQALQNEQLFMKTYFSVSAMSSPFIQSFNHAKCSGDYYQEIREYSYALIIWASKLLLTCRA